MEEEYFIVDFESVTIDKETYDKLENDPQYAIDWIINNAKIDQIIRGDEKWKIINTITLSICY